MDTRREATLQRQIEKTKRDLAALGDLRPGSLSTQYNVCGSPGCRCKGMGVSTYRTTPELPKEVTDLLPSIESLVAEFNIDAEIE